MPKPKKKKIFTNQNRLRADSRMLSKGINTLYQGRVGLKPSERYGVTENQVTLKRSLKATFRSKILSAKEKAKSTKNPFKILNVFLKERNLGEYRNGPMTDEFIEKRDNGKIRITKKKGKYSKNKKPYKSTLTHELIHSMHLPNNNICANAFESYLLSSFENRKLKRTPKEIVNRASKLDALLRKSKSTAKEYEKVNGVSPNSIGKHLGEIARDIELQIGKLGSGLFFLREILNGHSVTFTISRISQGEFDNEINDWLKMNPRLARLLK